MRNSIAAGRRLATRVVVVQLAVTLLLAALFSLHGQTSALAALVAGLSVTASGALFALRLFGSSSADAGFVFARFIGGTLLKWLIVIGGFYIGLVRYALPPWPMLCALIATLCVYLFGLRFKD